MANSYKMPLPRLGLDLRSDETELPAGAVRRADNVDIRSSGRFSRRAGYAVAVAGDGFHSAYSTARGTVVVRGSQAYIFDPSTLALTLSCDLGSKNFVDFTELNNHLFFGNEASLWWIPNDAHTAREVGVRLPANMPLLSPGAGSLLPGKYTLALSRVDSRGEESPTAVVGDITIVGTGGITLSGMVADLTSTYRVYLTPPDGDVLYLAEEFSGAFTTYVVATRPDGKTRSTQHLAPMKPGTFVAGHGGRLYTALRDTLYFSEPLRYGLYDPRYNFITFSGKIRFLAPVEGGLFIGDDRGTWFMEGKDPSNTRLALVSNSPAIFRSGLVLPGGSVSEDVAEADAPVAVWLSTEGYMVGAPSGTVTPLHPEKINVDPRLEGRSRFVNRDGVKQVITLISSAGTLGFGLATDTLQ